MSRGINKMIVIGMLGEDPELKYTISGKPIANVSLAVKEEWGNEENQKHTDWFIVEAHGKGAEFMGQYLHQGDYIYLEGKVHTDQWEKDGVIYYTARLIAKDFLLLLPNPDHHAVSTEIGKTGVVKDTINLFNKK